MKYRGWIPTVGGRLSFRVIGDTDFPTKCVYFNVECSQHEYILAVQNRPLSDALFPGITRHIFRLSTDFPFVFVSRVRRGDDASIDTAMIGFLYAFRDIESYNKSAALDVDNVIENFRNYQNQFRKNQNDEETLHRQYKNITQILKENADFSAKCIVNRDGVVTIWGFAVRDFEIEKKSRVFAEKWGFDFDFNFCDQFYFFLKDISHKHKHHNATSDTIITLQEFKKKRDNSWSNSIIFSLYYHVIRNKRELSHIDHNRSKGILAYAQSFKSIMKRRNAKIGFHKSIPDFNDSALLRSIDASHQMALLEADSKNVERRSKRDFLLGLAALVVVILTLMLSFAGDEEIHFDPTFSCMSRNIYEYPWSIFFLIISFASIRWTVKIIFPRIKKLLIIRDISRIAMYYNKILSTTVLTSISIMCLGIGIYIVPNFITGEKLIEGRLIDGISSLLQCVSL